jgi:Subtilase family
VPHRSFRSTLVPVASGIAAVIVISGAAGSVPALAAGGYGGAVQSQEWWLNGLHVRQAWPEAEGAGVTVAVLSTGVDAGHPDLAGAVTTGPDFTGSGRTAGGPFWGIDGTAVAGVIAGHGHGTGGAAGLLGVAPAARILSVRVNLEYNDPLNSDPALARRLPGAIAQGIMYAAQHGARVIDLPLDPGTAGLSGRGDPAAAGGSQSERAAVSYALSRNVVLVAPAGDDGEGPGLVDYPAAYPGVIAVGAVARNGQAAPFSSRRSYVSLAAPGVALTSAVPPEDYTRISSTSASSGIVAGVAALILSRYPHLTVAQVTRALIGGATADGAPGTGHGIVDAARALGLAASIWSASQPRPAATPSPRPRKPVRTTATAANQASASTLAGSLVRDVVAGLCGLIVLLVALLLVVRSRRERARTAAAAAGSGSARPRSRAPQGQHQQRRPAPGPGPGPAAAGDGRPRLVPPGPADWTASGGWHGGSLGEMQPARPAPAAPFRPALTPPPRRGPRSARPAAGATPDSAGPPWEPAPEPEHTFGPLPMAPNAAFPPDPGPGIRVPGDMTALPAVSPDAGPPVPFDLTASPDPDFPPRPAPDDDPDNFPVPASLPARQSLGFAAAPVPVDFAPRPALDFTVPSRAGGVVLSASTSQAGSGPRAADPAPDFAPGPGPAPGQGDPSYIWDLAATDVFPAAADPASTPEAPGAVQADDDPGASAGSD